MKLQVAVGRLDALLGFSCRVIGYTGEADKDDSYDETWKSFSCRVIGYTGEARTGELDKITIKVSVAG